jgi:hypothetical protein
VDTVADDDSVEGASSDRLRGAMIGLAVGDALGATLEFRAPGTFEPITDMVGGGPFDLAPGEWTDDTTMALCLAESLIEKSGFDAEDQMRRYVRWYRDGYLSVKNRCFDIGPTTAAALRRFEKNGDPFAGDTDRYTAGNGSIMRLAPAPSTLPRHQSRRCMPAERAVARPMRRRRRSMRAGCSARCCSAPSWGGAARSCFQPTSHPSPAIGMPIRWSLRWRNSQRDRTRSGIRRRSWERSTACARWKLHCGHFTTPVIFAMARLPP